MDSIRKLFQRSFKDKSVMDQKEFYTHVRVISNDIAKSVLKDMEEMGLVKIEKKPRRIYDKSKLF